MKVISLRDVKNAAKRANTLLRKSKKAKSSMEKKIVPLKAAADHAHREWWRAYEDAKRASRQYGQQRRKKAA